jgi:NAD(P)H-hydrate epimerase
VLRREEPDSSPGPDPAGAADQAGPLRESDLAIDGLLGTGLKGAARPPLAGLIELVNDLPDLPVVALDVPSGLDADAGLPADDGRGASIIAAMTISFAANKAGYKSPGASHYTGRVIIGDIGVPRELVEEQAGLPVTES